MPQMIKKKVALDLILNFIASLLPIAVLQLFVYPIAAREIDSNAYGLMLTIYSMMILVANSAGVVLNNMRLLYDKKYREEKLNGDFNVLLLIALIGSSIIVCLMSYYYNNYNWIDIITILLTTILICVTAYLDVTFRINLDYVKIMVSSIFLIGGYFIGTVLFYFTSKWELIYFGAYLCKFLYICKNTQLLKEPIIKSDNFKNLTKESIFLLSSVILANTMSYADKIVLYPFLGGTAVSIYYTSTLLGKMISMLITPMNSVVLTYLARLSSLKEKTFRMLLIVGGLIGIIGYGVCMLITKPVISWLFPQWVDLVMEYVPVTTLAAIFSGIAGIIHPFVLRFCETKWQIVVYGSSAICYFISSIVLLIPFGLQGFCFGTAIGNFSKIIVMLIVYYKANKATIK